MHAKTGCECQPILRWSATSGLRRVIETGLEFKKGSLAMTGKLPAPASRIQVCESIERRDQAVLK
jgi:hypothetical protein